MLSVVPSVRSVSGPVAQKVCSRPFVTGGTGSVTSSGFSVSDYRLRSARDIKHEQDSMDRSRRNRLLSSISRKGLKKERWPPPCLHFVFGTRKRQHSPATRNEATLMICIRRAETWKHAQVPFLLQSLRRRPYGHHTAVLLPSLTGLDINASHQKRGWRWRWRWRDGKQ